jgi:hypothetical protein
MAAREGPMLALADRQRQELSGAEQPPVVIDPAEQTRVLRTMGVLSDAAMRQIEACLNAVRGLP